MTEPRDIVERLQAIADLKPGATMPSWLVRPGETNWAEGMSRLLNDAIAEIKRLRQ